MTGDGRSVVAVRVRRATPEDAGTIARFARALSRMEGDPTRHFTEAAVLRDGFGARPQFRALVAELDGKPVGYALDHDAYDSAWAASGVYLIDIYVAPQARRKGVGRALLAAVARAARRRKRTFVWWTSKAENAEAHAFYDRLGAKSGGFRAHSLSKTAFAQLADEGQAGPGQAGRG